MKLVCISDTHGNHRSITVPDGDILIHAGDFSRGKIEQVCEFNEWLASLPHKYKVVCAGNHDFALEQLDGRLLLTNAIYLQDRAVMIEGLLFYGSPWQPRFMDWAFNLDRGEPLRRKWEMIPDKTDVLITHGPPYGILDQTARDESVGCNDLLAAVERIRPKVHIFGHIHEAYGKLKYSHKGNTDRSTWFINAAICDLRYKAINEPIVIEL